MSQKPILVKKTMLTLNNFIAFTILPQKSNLLVFLLVVKTGYYVPTQSSTTDQKIIIIILNF